MIIDFHNHLIPGVDDGASTLDEARTALQLMCAEGVRGLVVTPHLSGSLTAHPQRLQERLEELDRGWAQLGDLAARDFPDLRIERGAEVMLDAPVIDVSEPRVRLAGTGFVLVEFPFMNVPPNSASAIFDLKVRGWMPVIAHPERYVGVDEDLHVVDGWRRAGGLLQVNSGSLVGRYGGAAMRTGWRLIHRGSVDYLSSDFHARGSSTISEARAELLKRGGAVQAALLLEVNPGRLLDGLEPQPVPPLDARSKSIWRRIFRIR